MAAYRDFPRRLRTAGVGRKRSVAHDGFALSDFLFQLAYLDFREPIPKQILSIPQPDAIEEHDPPRIAAQGA